MTARSFVDPTTKKEGNKLFISAYAQKNRICLGQIQIKEKSNEITIIPELIDAMPEKGYCEHKCYVGCQKNIVETIRFKKADYLIAVKNNQKALYEEIENLFILTKPASEHIAHDIDHRRSETIKCTLISEFTFLGQRKSWKGLASVIKTKTIDKSTKNN